MKLLNIKTFKFVPWYFQSSNSHPDISPSQSSQCSASLNQNVYRFINENASITLVSNETTTCANANMLKYQYNCVLSIILSI